MRRVRGSAAALLVVVASGCSGAPAAAPAPPASPSGVPQDEGGPLTGLPDCAGRPAPVPSGDPASVAGLLLPDGAVVTSVERTGPLVQVDAYVGVVPIAVRRFYQRTPGLELLEVEDEVLEAEVLYGDGAGHRSYVKARAVCAEGSVLLAVVGPVTSRGVPEPQGRG